MFPMRKSFGLFFLVLLSVTNLTGQIRSVQKVFAKTGSSNIISVTPKRVLKTQDFEKRAIFPVKKSIWPVLSRIIDCDKPQRTVYKDLQGILTFTLNLWDHFNKDLGGC